MARNMSTWDRINELGATVISDRRQIEDVQNSFSPLDQLESWAAGLLTRAIPNPEEIKEYMVLAQESLPLFTSKLKSLKDKFPEEPSPDAKEATRQKYYAALASHKLEQATKQEWETFLPQLQVACRAQKRALGKNIRRLRKDARLATSHFGSLRRNFGLQTSLAVS